MNEPSFFITNKKGDYFCASKTNQTQYQGWLVFLRTEWELYKTIDKINFNEDNVISDAQILNNTLIIELKKEQEITIDLDFRKIHDYNDEGRKYEIKEKKDLIIIKYIKYENNELKKITDTKYLAIKGLKNKETLNEWIQKKYPYDEERGALNQLFMYRALKGKTKKIILGFGKLEEEATINALIQTQKNKKEKQTDLQKTINAFNSLLKEKQNELMIFAGYPWFYQVWGRDETISLTGLISTKRFSETKKIIMRNIKNINQEGLLPNRYPESELGSADSTGWLFQRTSQYLNFANDFSQQELKTIEQKLDLFLEKSEQKKINGLIHNGPKETWMDTTDEQNKDTREGVRIEIQALHLSALNLKKELREKQEDFENVKKTQEQIQEMKQKIQEQLVHEDAILDGLNHEKDHTKRPNIFLAYYAYPELANKQQWEKTFDLTLKECWLEWGGLTSISKNNYLYRETYTGMNNKSYHRGDSWYFVNNIAAISMQSLNSKKYKKEIQQIKKASIKELKELGFIGQCAEISSAKEQQAKGCLSQAWSAATLIELLIKTQTKN